jgi:AmiR/NasT family two-component response regulator
MSCVDDLEMLEDVGQVLALQARVGELEDEIAQLREALARRQQYGVVTGMVAVRFGLAPERAWRFLVRLSPAQTKIGDVAAELLGTGRLPTESGQRRLSRT